MSAVYQPSRSFSAKIKRRSARFLAKRVITPKLKRGIVSLTFDDCPRSVLTNALPLIEAEGWRATIYACVGLCDTVNHLGLHMSEADLVEAHSRGHEIADHTFSHLDSAQAGPATVLADIAQNRAAFDRLGLPRTDSFAYPYGEVTPAVKRALAKEFSHLRGIHDPSDNAIDLNLAPSARLYSDFVDQLIALIQVAAEERQWVTLFSHDVRTSPSEFGCTPEDLSRVIAAINDSQLDVLPIRDALAVVQNTSSSIGAAA